jgi:hypothetical protein
LECGESSPEAGNELTRKWQPNPFLFHSHRVACTAGDFQTYLTQEEARLIIDLLMQRTKCISPADHAESANKIRISLRGSAIPMAIGTAGKNAFSLLVLH